MSNYNFVALDVETATSDPASICEIGIAIVQSSKVVSTKSWLVRPPYNKYDKTNIDIHHITPSETENGPDFKTVWNEVQQYISGRFLCAHYAQFDMNCLKACFEKYGISHNNIEYYCTCKMARKAFDVVNYKLDTLCEAFDISSPIKHRAGEDARRCAELFLKMMEIAKVDLSVFSDCKSSIKKKEISSDENETFFEDPYWLYSDKKLKDIIAKEGYADENNFFYGKQVAVFGEFLPYHRAEIWQKIADIGGIPQQTITQKTSVIVLGEAVDAKVLTKHKELADKGIQIEIISFAEFFKRYTANIPDNYFKDKNVCVAGSLRVGRNEVERFLYESGAVIQPRTTMKTDIVIDDSDHEHSNTATAKRYIAEKGLPIEILYTDKFLEIIPQEAIASYGFRIERGKHETETHETEESETEVHETEISIPIPETYDNSYDYYSESQVQDTKPDKKAQPQQKSGCMGVLLILILLGAIAFI